MLPIPITKKLIKVQFLSNILKKPIPLPACNKIYGGLAIENNPVRKECIEN
jgi:hypothetical protein